LSTLITGANRDWTVVTPPVERFGTHHTKCFLLVYDTGCRVCVHTANLIHGDVHKRTNAMWCQDFPLKSLNDLKTCAAESEFEHDLTRYLGALGWKDDACVVPGMGNGQAVTVGPSAMRRFDFRGAGAKLVASIPGRWKGGDMNCWCVLSLPHYVLEYPITTQLRPMQGPHRRTPRAR
tara:strand:+ start:883 stop:1416 length:534 start_codon:yes stop_codon:yes gene_type:complete